MRGGMLPQMVMHKLAERPHSGYGLCTAIEDATGRRPSYGSIYPLLERLAQEGKVEAKEEGRKKMYSLTPKGRIALKEMESHLQDLVEQTAARVRALFELTGQDPAPILAFLERLKGGEPPLGKATARMFLLRDTIFTMAQEGRIDKHHKEINTMIDATLKRLEEMR